MTFSRRSFPHILSAALVAGVALVPVGCGGTGVDSYTAPKSSEPTGPKFGGGGGPAAEGGEYRILGAMFPADDPQWFFKLTGTAEGLNPHVAGFDKLLESVSLGGGAPDFTPPEGWQRGPGRAGIVVATIRTPDNKFEVTVTSSTGGVVPNLRRWAVDQLGAPSFEASDVPKATKTVDAKGVKGLRVDLRGPKNPAGKGGPFMGGK